MTISIPTAAAFKQRYRGFAALDDALVDLAIAEGVGAVSEDWAIGDRKPGVLAYAAHVLALEGYGYGDVAGPVKAVQVGDVKTDFSDVASARVSFKAGSDSGLSQSVHGRHYLDLRRRNVAAVAVV